MTTTTNPTSDRVGDVIVVGAGPTGLVAALSLARQGVDVTVLESGPGPSTRSRASTFHASTLDLLAELGVADALVECGRIAPRLQYRDRTDGIVAELDYATLAEDTQHPYRLQVEQRQLTRLAYERLRTYPNAHVHFDTTVDGIVEGPDHAAVSANGRRYAARWVIGADGSHSAVRTGLGLTFDGVTYERRYLTVMVDLDIQQLLPDVASVTYVWGGNDGMSMMALRDHWRVVFRIGPEESDEEAIDDAHLQRRLRAAVSSAIDRYPIIDSFVFAVHRRGAETFHRGRFLLAGDAAHLNSPSGGMGMNSGIHDAYVFAERLGQVIGGRAGLDDLAQDAAERRRVARELVGARSDRNYKDILETDEDERIRRREEMRQIAADPQLTREYLLRASMFDSAPRPLSARAA